MDCKEQSLIKHIVRQKECGIEALKLPNMTIGMVLKGAMIVYHNQLQTRLNPKSVFILKEGLHYVETICDDGCFEQIVFSLPAAILQQTIASISVSYDIDYRNCGNFAVCRPSALLSDFFESLVHGVESSELYDNFDFQRLRLSELLFILHSQDDERVKRMVVSGADVVHSRFAQVMYNNIFNDRPMEELAQQTSCSLSTFKKEFSELFHATPHRWFVEQRLQQAEILLRSTTKSVGQISDQCVFTNISHFIRLFKRRYHTTPAAYRRAIRIKYKE